jgi:hypothetical protein
VGAESTPVIPSASPSPSVVACRAFARHGPRCRARERELLRGRLVLALLALEQGILLQHAVDLGVELEGRQLQQPDRLLQLRRKREVLSKLEL